MLRYHTVARVCRYAGKARRVRAAMSHARQRRLYALPWCVVVVICAGAGSGYNRALNARKRGAGALFCSAACRRRRPEYHAAVAMMASATYDRCALHAMLCHYYAAFMMLPLLMLFAAPYAMTWQRKMPPRCHTLFTDASAPRRSMLAKSVTGGCRRPPMPPCRQFTCLLMARVDAFRRCRYALMPCHTPRRH